ncbi:MAG: gamma-glutamyltransferase [Chloroflexi bacterium]|nr:gamma-glutamyltransferase [Chloroflexota bacterium]
MAEPFQGVPGTSPSYAAQGMVASKSPAAAAAGLRVLMDGGNAFDAAVATALVEGLMLPSACGLGGDMFAVLYDARTKMVHGINGSGTVPRAVSREYYISRGYEKMPLSGIHSVSIPGAPHAYWTLHQRFGSNPWAELVEPAIRCAAEGIAVSERFARSIAGAQRKLTQCDASAEVFFPGGEPPRPGTLFQRPGYAESLRVLARAGADAFYRGAVAEEIVRYAQSLGSPFDLEDFAAHTTEVYEPINTTYRGVQVFETRPPSQGLIVLEWLNLLEGFDLAASGFGTVDTLHLMAEAKKLAFADRLRYAGDPRFVDVPLDELLSKSFAVRRRRAIDPARAASQVEGTLPETLHGDTSYFCAVDGEGNAVSLIHSLSAGWGSGIVGGATGILLNNRAGRGFTLEEGHPNVIAGGKKTMHTLNCFLLMRDNTFWAVGGTPGGDQQPQMNVQVITNLLDFGMDVQQAVEAPRWYSFPGTDPDTIDNPFELRLESRYGPDVFTGLDARGHRAVELKPWGGPGAFQFIMREPSGVLVGGSDPRAGGIALGF